MKALLLLIAAMTFGVFTTHAADALNRKADRELLGRLHFTPVPALTMREVPIEHAIARYLELLAAEWHTPKPIPYRIERRKPQPQQPPLPAEFTQMVTFGFARRGFADALSEVLPLVEWSYTVRDGVLVFTNSKDLYQDEIWQRPILLPK